MKIETTGTHSVALGSGSRAMHVTATTDLRGHLVSLSIAGTCAEGVTLTAEQFDRVALVVERVRERMSGAPHYATAPYCCADHGYHDGYACDACAGEKAHADCGGECDAVSGGDYVEGDDGR